MRVAIVGAGALGSILGGYFAEAGADVTLVARRAHAEAIRKGGLVIEGIRGHRVIRGLSLVEEPQALTEAELLILAVKSFDSPGVLPGLAHLRGRVGAALSVQNGGGKDEALAGVLGAEAVLGATTIVGGSMPEPGRVVHTGEGYTWVGEFDGRRTERLEAIVALYRRAGLAVEIPADIRSAIWCKLNQMTPAATLACVSRLYLHQVYQDPQLAALFVELSREIARIAPRLGIALGDYPGFPVRTLCEQPFEAAVASVVARGRLMEERGMTGVKISTLQDLDRGRRTEAAEIIGYVLEQAAAHSVPMPMLEVLYRVIRGVETAQLSAAG
jgi:2-dehydropantoate 2-reductase